MGLSWQQGPLSTGTFGKFIVPGPLPKGLLYVEQLRRPMRVRFGGSWIVDSENVLLLFEPGRYPVAYFPEGDISPDVLEKTDTTTRHSDLGLTSWYGVRADAQHVVARGAWQHIDLPAHAGELQGRVAFAWRAMDAFYEEDERILGHAADPYHRIDIRQTSRNLVVRQGDRIVAETKRPLVLYESGFAPRWYVPRNDIDASALTPVKLQTFCPYKGLCNYYSIGDARQAAWSYPEVRRISNLISFEPDIVSVHLDGTQLRLALVSLWSRTAPIATSTSPSWTAPRVARLASGPRIKARRDRAPARLLSMTVGLPRGIACKGRIVRTPIWKGPVDGQCRVGRLNLEGDGEADLRGHGGEQRAAFVYQIESYRHWQGQLNRTDFRPWSVRREFDDRRIA